ncbi:MAG: hypothetical protein L7H21_06630 [Sulfolobales archaeon]|nr:hypothetical protein [Sulfolobales archaeon]MCG2893698.1 hypothetical protein [Sulfolobales archaeon]MCG2911281.1 hypothetical protein [Sulfolobales archaeon]
MICALLYLSDESLFERGEEGSLASELLREALHYARKSGDKRLSVFVMKPLGSAKVFEAFRSAIQDNLDISLTIYSWKGGGFPKLENCKVLVICDETYRQDKVTNELPNEIKVKVEKYLCKGER